MKRFAYRMIIKVTRKNYGDRSITQKVPDHVGTTHTKEEPIRSSTI